MKEGTKEGGRRKWDEGRKKEREMKKRMRGLPVPDPRLVVDAGAPHHHPLKTEPEDEGRKEGEKGSGRKEDKGMKESEGKKVKEGMKEGRKEGRKVKEERWRKVKEGR